MSKKHCKHIEQRNKYLDDLGLDFFEYGVNWTRKETKKKWRRAWRKQRETYGFDDRETYDMTRIFGEWLYSHLMMYRWKASKVIDLTYHKIEFEGNTYTQIEALDRMIEWTEFYLRNRDDPDRYDESLESLQRATRLWEPFLAHAWW